MANPSNLPEPHGYVGIDFGTCNSHFAYCNLDGPPHAQPIPLGGMGLPASIATCILWKEPRTNRIRHPGLRGRGPTGTGARPPPPMPSNSVLAPRSSRTSNARRKPATMRGIPASGVPGDPEVQRRPRSWEPAKAGRWSFGCRPRPAASTRDLRPRLPKGLVLAKSPAWPEPLGALAFHLAHGDLTLEEARKGIVVIDFGGGTLDVAVVDAKGLREPWGDTSLGGRLFDDLFYQWLADQIQPTGLPRRISCSSGKSVVGN